MATQLLLRDVEKPREKTLSNDINWICESFGIYELIDKDKTAANIFRQLIESMAKEEGMTSTELSVKANVTRSGVLKHLKKMMIIGLVVQDGRQYRIRCSGLYRTILEIKHDVEYIFENMESMAIEIDEEVGIKQRQ